MRAEGISSRVTLVRTPRLERVRSVSGDLDLTDVSADGDFAAGTVSGSVRMRRLRARAFDVNSVSGDVLLADVACERAGIRSTSGTIDYAGTLAKNGHYDLTSHSGTVHLTLAGDTGFELTATSFSGSIRSDLPLTLGGEPDRGGIRGRGPNRALHATYGNASAVLTVRTFSGDIVLSKQK